MTEHSVSPPTPLCFFPSYCLLLLFFLSTFWRLEKIFLSGHQWMNGDVFTCLRPPPPLPPPLHDNGTFNGLLTECISPPATCRSLGPVSHWCHRCHWLYFHAKKILRISKSLPRKDNGNKCQLSMFPFSAGPSHSFPRRGHHQPTVTVTEVNSLVSNIIQRRILNWEASAGCIKTNV